MKKFIKNVLYTIEDISFYVLSAVFVLYLVFIMWSLSVNYMPHVNPENYTESIDYGILSDEQIETFNDILDAVENGESVISCPEYSYREKRELLTQLGLYFGVVQKTEGLIRWKGNSANLNLDLFEEFLSQKVVIDARIDEAVSTLIEGSDRYKLLQISNYISRKMNYEIGYYDTIPALNGRGVCGSYALLFYKMATRVGIETYMCYGYTGDAYHAWNMVKLNGKDVYFDVTWYDNVVHDFRYIFGQSSWSREFQLNNEWYNGWYE